LYTEGQVVSIRRIAINLPIDPKMDDQVGVEGYHSVEAGKED